MTLNGLPVYANPILTERNLIIMCRSKRKRIVKKWLQNEKNYRTVPSTQVYVMKDRIICHPVTFAIIREKLKQEK